MTANPRIAAALAAFDGHKTAPLKALMADGLTGEAAGELLARCPGPDEIGATWLLKALAEAGELTPEAARAAFAKLSALTEADAVLHVLQLAQLVDGAADGQAAAIRARLDHARMLVRVWALDALVRADPKDVDVHDLVRAALDAPEGSMRARARRLAPLCIPPVQVARSP